ncbi:MAG TPA: CoA transferase [Candidatus Dormibacteraeota bacterium]|nr:CoA transferase [Candidatus Dormibacteraeota bacterium]
MLLQGIKVLDLSTLLPGAYCTRILQLSGASILKVEPPGGDPIRRLPGGDSYFETLHAGKSCVTLDWRVEEDRAHLRQEIAASDVLLEGFRPGVMDRAGFGADNLAQLNPRLIVCSITGFGSSGPRAKNAGHDLNYLALSGALALMPRTTQGAPLIPGMQIADYAGGLYAAFLIAAGLAGRGKTGPGCRLEVSMTDVMRGWSELARRALASGAGGVPLTGSAPCYRVYRVADGYLAVAALEEKFWKNFCGAIQRPDLVPRQFDASAIPEVEAVLAGRDRAAWIKHFDGRDACVEACVELDE